jgi:hypothetical protein
MRVKDLFLSLGHFKLNGGRNIWFWEDRWLASIQNLYVVLETRCSAD